jgi:methionine salvage enolase-phosphatase E1
MDEHLREMLAGYVDDELSDEQKKAFEKELANNAELRAELDKFRKLKEVTGMVQYADLPLAVWESYWSSLYRKLERGIGWILFSVGAVILLLFGLYVGLRDLYIDPNVSLWVKIGVTGVGAGLIILLVSFVRERLFAYRRERYREVIR